MVFTVVAFILFSRDEIPLRTTSLLVIVLLPLGFYLFPYQRDGKILEPTEFFLGFGNEVLVAICALMILGRGLVATGALEPLARALARTWASYPQASMLLMLLLCLALSGLVNDTPVVVLLLPILMGVALRTGTVLSKMLMPMNFAVLMGGMGTSIGTSTNLLVVSISAELGGPRFGVFDFIHIAAIAAAGGILYLWLIAPRLLPGRDMLMSDASPRVFNAVLHINEDSFANGKSLSEVMEKAQNKLQVEQIQRGDGLFLAKRPTLTLSKDDRLFVADTPENLKEFEKLLGATLYNVSDIEHPVSKEHPLTAEGQQLAEVVVTEGSPLYNTTLKRAGFTQRYQLVILAIHRAHARPAKGELSDIVLQTGDVLLVQGAADQIKELKASGALLVLDATIDLPHSQKAPYALLIMFGVVACAALGLLPISISALVGVGLMLISRCLNWDEVGSALSSRVVLLIVASLALGAALTRTGGTEYLARLYLVAMSGLSPQIILSVLILMMAVMTNFVSNNAAAAVGTPIAFSIAQQLHVAPEPFVLAILFGCNLCYATPMGYQTNLLVMSAAGYKFSDFLRVGIPLMFIMWLSFSFLLPAFYPL